MALNNVIQTYVVPIAGGFFILLFVCIFFFIIYKTVMKPLGMIEGLKKMLAASRIKKILQDEKIVEYCVNRVHAGYTEGDVKAELLLANKYNKKKIQDILFAFAEVKKEIGVTTGKKELAKDLP